MFHGGWRPLIGWLCLTSLFYNWQVLPLLSAWLHVIPSSTTDIITVLGAFGGLRTYEKLKGVAK
jgi:hypothetical protein